MSAAEAHSAAKAGLPTPKARINTTAGSSFRVYI
jgi:hypothetical protein